jgi:CubicO group peptidase (beta-lactamase class C family)
MPMRKGRQITLLDLATHTSGLPRLPSNLKPTDPENPYAEYSVQNLYDFLSGLKLTRNIGSQYLYSNLGGGLLGHVLSLQAGMDYECLLRSRICESLGLSDTAITLSTELKARMATGHNSDLQPVPLWDLPTLAGAGALRSTANDLLSFLAANLGYLESPLAPAVAKMLTVRRSTGNPNCMVAIGWHILARHGREIAWHNGGTGGFRSFMGYDQTRGLGVVVLSNTGTAAGVDDIALRLLESD